jgi:hypothetical protein
MGMWGGFLTANFCAVLHEAWIMPFYYFDLVIDGRPSSQGSMILEDLCVASDRADALATELRILRPELRCKDCFIRVVDENDKELYRTPLDPIPSWLLHSAKK